MEKLRLQILEHLQLEKKIAELAETQKQKKSKLFLKEMLFYLSLQMNLKKK